MTSIARQRLPTLLKSLSIRTFLKAQRGSTSNHSLRYHSSSTQPPSSKDPSHPYLHYHPLPQRTPPRLALSFLPTPPSISKSRTVIGYLPLDSNAGLNDFEEEPSFLKVLHGAIKEGLALGLAEAAEFEAQSRPGDGYIHITDERAIPPAGRIGETEDLIGSVFVQSGKVIASTYDPLPTYRVITPNGVVLLPKGLDQYLIEVLEKIDAEERNDSRGGLKGDKLLRSSDRAPGETEDGM